MLIALNQLLSILTCSVRSSATLGSTLQVSKPELFQRKCISVLDAVHNLLQENPLLMVDRKLKGV